MERIQIELTTPDVAAAFNTTVGAVVSAPKVHALVLIEQGRAKLSGPTPEAEPAPAEKPEGRKRKVNQNANSANTK